MFSSLAALAVAFFAIGQSAQASVITYNNSVPSIQITGQSGIAAIHQFDSSLGTLTAVDITGSVSYFGTAFGTRSGPPGSFAGAQALETFNLAITNSTLGINQSLSASVGISGFASFPGPFPLNGNGSTAITPISDTNVAHFGVYTGTGTFALNFATSNFQVSNLSTGSGVTVSSFGGSIDGGNIRVTYTYTPTPPPNASVPEPASLSVFGLLGASLLIRRRWAKAVN